MGWASMNEDNESRFFNATIIRNEVDKKVMSLRLISAYCTLRIGV